MAIPLCTVDGCGAPAVEVRLEQLGGGISPPRPRGWCALHRGKTAFCKEEIGGRVTFDQARWERERSREP